MPRHGWYGLTNCLAGSDRDALVRAGGRPHGLWPILWGSIPGSRLERKGVMRSFLKEATATAVFLLAVALMLGLFFLALCCQSARGDALEDCIRATCRIKAGAGPMKGVGTGVLYDVATRGGEPTAFVATAAHVVEGSGPWVCEFDRVGVKVPMRIYWRVPGHDGALLIAPRAAFGPRLPRPVPLLRRGIRLRVGQPIFSIGCPGGGKLMLWRGRAQGYEQSGSMLFRPWPELGRSGSPIFALYEDGAPCVVAIISARYSGPHDRVNEQTLGRATSIDEFWSGSASTRPTNATLCQGAITVPGGCPGGSCPGGSCELLPPGFSRDYALPYRRQEQDRNQYILQQKGQERSPGTLPLPPVSQQPDLGPLTERLSRAELVIDSQGREIAELKARQDAVKQAAEKLAKDFPEVKRELEKALGKASEAQSLAETASKNSAQARGTAEQAANRLDENLDENASGGLFSRIKARIEEAKAAGAEGAAGVAKSVVWGIVQSYGFPIGTVAAVVLFLVYRDIRAKITTGDPLLVEKVAARVHERLGPVRERIIERVGGVRERVQAKLHPQETEQEG